MKIKDYILLGLAVFMITGVALFGGIQMGKQLADKIYYPVYIPYAVEKIVYVEVPVEIEVEKTVYTNEVRNFESREDLINWLSSIRKDKQLAAKPDWNCIDYAWWLLDRGRIDGYLVVYYPIDAASFNSLFKLSHLNEGTWHRVCAVYIDNLTYLVEPWNFEVIP